MEATRRVTVVVERWAAEVQAREHSTAEGRKLARRYGMIGKHSFETDEAYMGGWGSRSEDG
jgi:hypothetical protein